MKRLQHPVDEAWAEYVPCPCAGNCGSDCPCIKSKNFCEKVGAGAGRAGCEFRCELQNARTCCTARRAAMHHQVFKPLCTYAVCVLCTYAVCAGLQSPDARALLCVLAYKALMHVLCCVCWLTRP